MPRTLAQASTADLPDLIRCWNQIMVYDTMSREEMSRALFTDHRHATLVARLDGYTVGFVGCITPEAGTPTGHITVLCAPDETVAVGLLARAEDVLRSRGVSRVMASEYGGSPLAPGTDPRYSPIGAGFRRAGFSHSHDLEDMERCLSGYGPSPHQQRATERATAYGVQVIPWCPELVQRLARFAGAARASGDLPAGWFCEGWEQGPNMVVGIRGDEVVGFASYDAAPQGFYGRYHRRNAGAFGPTGVMADHRGHGVGTWMLAEACLAVKRAGREWLWAGWTNTPFYVRNDWTVCRRYAVWEKTLEG